MGKKRGNGENAAVGDRCDSIPTETFRREEKKFFVGMRPPEAAAAEIAAMVPPRLLGGEPEVVRRRTTYFDTSDLRMYREHIEKRAVRRTIRVRESGLGGEFDSLCSIELKMKDHGVSTKCRFLLPRDTMEAFLGGENVWKAVRSCNPARGLEQTYMTVRAAVLADALQPLLQARSERASFEREDELGRCRLTLEREIEFELLGAGVVYPMDLLILEEKLRGFRPEWRRGMLDRIEARRAKRFSEYANAIEYLSSVPRAAEYLASRRAGNLLTTGSLMVAAGAAS